MLFSIFMRIFHFKAKAKQAVIEGFVGLAYNGKADLNR